MRAKYFVGVIIGLLLLYMGFMGASGIGFSFTSLSSLPAHEDFNDLSNWNSYTASGASPPLMSPAGQVQLQAGTSSSGADDRSAIRSGTISAMSSSSNPKLTVTLDMSGNTWGNGNLGVQIYSDTWSMMVGLYQNKITVAQSTGTPVTFTHSVDTSFHQYTMAIDSAAKSCVIGVDGVTVGTATSACFGAGVAAQWLGLSLDASDGLLCHIDYVYIDAGAGPGPSSKYGLTINAQDSSGNVLSVPVTVTDAGGDAVGPRNTPASFGPYSASTVTITATSTISVGGTSYGFTHWNDDFSNTSPTRTYAISSTTTLTATYTAGVTPTSGSISVSASNYPFDCWYSGSGHVTVSGSYTFSNVPTGSTTVYGTYNGVTKSASVTVQNGNTASVYLDFSGGGSGGGGILDNITALIRQALNNANIRQFEMLIGGLTAGISAIIFVLPASRPRYQYPPQQYPRYY